MSTYEDRKELFAIYLETKEKFPDHVNDFSEIEQLFEEFNIGYLNKLFNLLSQKTILDIIAQKLVLISHELVYLLDERNIEYD